jgi:hypothetical protein
MMTGQHARRGDIVRILAMPSDIVSGLPRDDVDFLRRAVGDYGVIRSLSVERTAEVEIARPSENRIHCVWLKASDLEFIERGGSFVSA